MNYYLLNLNLYSNMQLIYLNLYLIIQIIQNMRIPETINMNEQYSFTSHMMDLKDNE